tara:strand:+ start:96 stop:572 length:477 start_codon:yes stop_codon:yes gene_type:complete
MIKQLNSCDDCNMCCKLPEIPSINKKSFSWCTNCEVGQGCKIYEKRPKKCKDFYCAYALGFTNLKPNKYGFFIFPENEKSYEEKVFTVYCEEHRLNTFIKHITSDEIMVNALTQGWSFHIRYNNDDNDLAIFDLKRFGNSIKKIQRAKELVKVESYAE